MKTFLFKLTIFLVLFYLLDSLFLLFKYHNDNLFAKISQEKMDSAYQNYFRTNLHLDMLIMGSSHAQFGVDPKIISNLLGQHGYNLAYGGGTNIGDQILLLRACLERTPELKKILFFVDVFSLNYESDETPSQFIEQFLSESSHNNIRPKRLSKIIPLLSNAYKYRMNIPRYLKDLKNGDWQLPLLKGGETYNLQMFSHYYGYEITQLGFVKGHGILNRGFIRYKGLDFDPKISSISLLKEYISLCKERGIDILLVQIPEHQVARNYSYKYKKFNSWMNAFCMENNLTYIDMNNISEFPINIDSYFFDSDHLNCVGAQLFTKLLVQKLLQHSQTHTSTTSFPQHFVAHYPFNLH